MSQVTIYMDEDCINRAKIASQAAQLSLSAWVSKLVKTQVTEVDVNGYPKGFFETIAQAAPLWQDFPTAEQLRANDAPDLPRETW